MSRKSMILSNVPELPEDSYDGPVVRDTSYRREQIDTQNRQERMLINLEKAIAEDKENAKLPPLYRKPTRSKLTSRWDPDYVQPSKILNTIEEVLQHRCFYASYPQTFAPITTYYLDKNIPPPYTVHPDEDYSFGVLTIASMIELVHERLPWKLYYDDDVPLVIDLAGQYRDKIAIHSREGAPNSDIKDYYTKVDHFIQFMQDKRDAIEYRNNKHYDRTDIFSFMELMKRIF